MMQPARFVECEFELTDHRFADEDEHAGEDTATDRAAALQQPGESDAQWQKRVVALLEDGSYYGWSGCEALALRKALDAPTTNILVTDDRVLVIDVNNVDEPEIEWEQSRTAMHRVWKHSRFMEPGRVIMVLSDGSVLVVHVGVLGGKRAESLVTACTEAR
ncbi:hypothetical protein [Gulosibacter bifidus]|uniref:Uncharacterized protein n=1 Tax=Gulosibacter bifidus TaxID=272239 RepID=A0ABW5RI60_9MICO|nr:hypothetical protein [Gulosibacter bifidus]